MPLDRRSLSAFVASAICGFSLSDCSGSASTSAVTPRSAVSPVAAPSDDTLAAHASASLTISIPRPPAAGALRRRAFVGSATNAATVAVSDDASGATLQRLVVDLSATSKSCNVTTEAARSCTFTIALSPTAPNDSDDVSIVTYDMAPVNGKIPSAAKKLAAGTAVAQQIVIDTANVIRITLDGVPKSVVANVPRIVFENDSGERDRTFAFSALDADGETIVGTYAGTITLSIDDPSRHVSIGVGSTGSAATDFSDSAEAADVIVAYDGDGGANFEASIAVSGVPSTSSVPISVFSVMGPAAYAPSNATVTFTSSKQAVPLTLEEPGFTGTFTESDTCAGIATVSIGSTSNGIATATVTSGASGTCIVNFGDGYFHNPAVSLDDPGSGTDPTLATIGNDVTTVANADNVPGAAIDVYDHGKAYTYYYGVADRKSGRKVSSATGFELGSVTKSFTALDLALAVDDPALLTSFDGTNTVTSVSLTDPAAKYVPKYPAAAAETTTESGASCPPLITPTAVPSSGYSGTWNGITVRDLADHTSTLPDQPPNVFGPGTLPVGDRPCYPSQLLENYAATYASPSGETVGTSYTYSDIAYGLLGDSLEGMFDTDYFTLTKGLVLSKLSMPNTYDVNHASAAYGSNYATPYMSDGSTPTFAWPYNAWPGGGTLRSTAPDMMNYLQAALRIGADSQIDAAMKTAETPVPGVFAGKNVPQGLAWSSLTEDTTAGNTPFTLVQKDGATGGMTAWIGVVNPGSTKSLGIVVLVNEAGGGDAPGAASPATSIGVTIARDLGP